jgi:protein involved in polysaccharide export with SLBB domain
MRLVVCLLAAAALSVGCGAQPKKQKGSAQRSSATKTTRVTAGGRPGPTAPAPVATPPRGDTGVAPPVLGPAAGAAPAMAGKTADLQAELDPRVYRLAPGDGVHIDVFNEPELTVNAGIGADGMINYPLLGHIPAGGMTVRELEDRMVEELKRGYLVQPSVRVSIHHFRPIFIMGMVRKVGPHPFSPGLTVEKALATAGGITEYGSTKKIYIQHTGQTEAQKEKVNLDDPVRPGDTIIVEERLF